MAGAWVFFALVQVRLSADYLADNQLFHYRHTCSLSFHLMGHLNG
jgi:hypothetical protein